MGDNHDPTLTAFAPVAAADARLLILGSMPGVASLDAQQYYAHPRNAFWPIVHEMFGTCPAPLTYDEKLELLIRARIALWDVLAQCRRRGSLDANIDRQSVVCNDFAEFLAKYSQIRKIAFNGKAAEQLFRKHALPHLDLADDVSLVSLPSSSPAMASLTTAQKASIWQEQLL